MNGYKQILWILVLSLYTAAGFGMQHQERGDAAASCEKKVILWDIHDVMLEGGIKQYWKAFWAFDRKWEILYTVSPEKGKEWRISWNLVKDMLRTAYVKYTKKKVGITGEAFMAVAEQHGNPALSDLILTIANEQNFIPGTVEIVKKLKALGYAQHIGSNIGKRAFAALQTMPHTQSLFGQDADVFDIEASHVVDYSVSPPVRKPNPDFFHDYLAKNQGLAPECVVFIDDQKKNTDSAESVGMKAIVFKNAAQLERSLSDELGVDLSTVDLNAYAQPAEEVAS